jgi:hypothetical protein
VLVDISKKYFFSLSVTVEQYPKEIDNFINCLICLDVLVSFKESKYEDDEFCSESLRDYFQNIIISQGTQNFKSQTDFLNSMARVVAEEILSKAEISLDDKQIYEIFDNGLSVENFVKLVNAARRMVNSAYREVFLRLLALDLTGNSVKNFLHDSRQADPIGREIAGHNYKIREKLTKSGINPTTALEYPHVHHFTVSMIDGNNKESVLHTSILKLIENIEKTLNSDEDTIELNNEYRLKAILTSLKQLKNLIYKEVKEGRNPLTIRDIRGQHKFEPLIEKISKNIETLKSKRARLEESFYDAITAITQPTENAVTKTENNSSTYSFYVEQWPKERVRTSFLADKVSCCLATDATEFQALVQRRIDDAMLFHVVTDQTTKEAVALIWLYLVETDEGNILLMANFFEIYAGYARNELLRQAILSGTLQFTAQYLKDNPNIRGFYMNQLSYGWNKGDIDYYPIKSLRLKDKLGGPYVPGSLQQGINQPELVRTNKFYYLVSLGNVEFHEFCPELLTENTPKSVIQGIPDMKLVHKDLARHSLLQARGKSGTEEKPADKLQVCPTLG